MSDQKTYDIRVYHTAPREGRPCLVTLTFRNVRWKAYDNGHLVVWGSHESGAPRVVRFFNKDVWLSVEEL